MECTPECDWASECHVSYGNQYSLKKTHTICFMNDKIEYEDALLISRTNFNTLQIYDCCISNEAINEILKCNHIVLVNCFVDFKQFGKFNGYTLKIRGHIRLDEIVGINEQIQQTHTLRWQQAYQELNKYVIPDVSRVILDYGVYLPIIKINR